MEKETFKASVELSDNPQLIQLFGSQDQNIRFIEDSFQVQITHRGEQLFITGEEEAVSQVKELLNQLQDLIARGISISKTDIITAVKMAKRGTLDFFMNLYNEEIGRTFAGKAIRAKTYGQQQYIHAIKKTDVVFGIGPAGTGKTFVAVVMAVQALKKGEVKKIILTRPAVEAGENLGFLPGDLKEKVDPYLRPLYDALYTVYGMEHTNRLLERGVIEVAPLAYMRGRTLEDSFIILDEAQNTTRAQMKMFLTRLGFGSKMIVNGDKSQIDLPKGHQASGLLDAERKLKGINGIAFVEFDSGDVVRHPIVSEIINAYSASNSTEKERGEESETKLRKFQESLGIFYLPALFGVTFLFLLILGWSNVQPTSYSFELNQVARETIRAPRTVEDKEQTEKNQQMAMDGVGDIYVFDQNREQQQIDKVKQFFQAIKTVAAKASSEIFATDSTTTTSGEVSTKVATLQDRLTYFKKSLESENKAIRDFALYIPDSVIIQLLSVSSDKLDDYESAIENAIKEQMDKSITESNLLQAQEAAKKSLFNGGFTDAEREMLGQLLTNSIVVNNVVDKDATNSAKENAKQSVSPVRILQGQVLIQEGHIITQEDLRLLKLLGIDGTSSNYHQLYSYLIFLTILFASLLAFSFRFKVGASSKEWDTRVNELTVFSVVFSIGAILLKILSFLQNRGIDYIGVAFPIAGFIYIIYKLTSKFYFTIIAMLVYPILVWYMFGSDGINTEIALTTVYFSLAAWLGVIQDVYWKDLSWFKQLLLQIIIPLALMVPFVFFSNYDLVSTQSAWLFAFAAVSGFLSFLIPVILMPYFTYLFEDSSVLLWAELSNPNQPLLKDLITKAPGTYHHSLMVANISANCVEAIGGDSQLARVACYYHDIGKTEHPFFFIENLPAHMESPHKMIGPYESKEIIFDHVRKGVEILKQHQLPQSVIDICAEHHGTTLMKYFYAEALKDNPDADEADFRYPGPKPQTKESAVINIVDSAEAATRAMKEPTLEKVQNLVHSIIMNRLEDGQFVECDITLKELAIIEKNIVASLNGTFHSRIEYPKLPKKQS